MTRRCILHIGMNKAGSTSLQQAYCKYDDGETYYLPFEGPNHSVMMRLIFSSKVPKRFFRSDETVAQREQIAALRTGLEAALAADRRSVIISGEELCNFRDSASISSALAFLRARYDQIDGLCYVREPGGYIASLFQQVLKVGAPAFDPEQLFPKYRARLSGWVDQLGPDGLRFVAFHPANFIGGDLLADFSSRLGLSLAQSENKAVRRNSSLSAEAVAVLFRYRMAIGPPMVRGPEMEANRRLIRRLMSFGKRKFVIDPALTARLVGKFAAEIDWMQEHTEGQIVRSDPSQDAVAIADKQQLLVLAQNSTAAFRDWVATSYPAIKKLPQGTVAMMDVLCQRELEAVNDAADQ